MLSLLFAIIATLLSPGYGNHHSITRRDAPSPPSRLSDYGPPGHIPPPPLSNYKDDGVAAAANCVKTTPQQNKESVVALYKELFGPGHTDEGRKAAVEKYIGPDYIQHNPMTLSGPDTLLKTLKSPFWQGLTDYKIVRLIAEDDFVVVHDRMDFGERSFVFLDILRFECGKANEHWDVIQPITGKEVNPLAFF